MKSWKHGKLLSFSSKPNATLFLHFSLFDPFNRLLLFYRFYNHVYSVIYYSPEDTISSNFIICI